MQKLNSKVCKMCQTTKSLDEFGPWKAAKDGRFHLCRPCASERQRIYTSKNRARVSANRSRRYQERKGGAPVKTGGRTRRSYQEFLNHLFNNSRKQSNCRIWNGLTDAKGYGLASHEDFVTRRIHRIVYCIANDVSEESIKGFEICHSCDTPLCFEQKHLFKGTAMDNSDDKISKNRHLLSLKPGQIEEIRALIGHESLAKIGRRFGVSWGMIRCIREGERHVKTDRIKSPFVKPIVRVKTIPPFTTGAAL